MDSLTKGNAVIPLMSVKPPGGNPYIARKDQLRLLAWLGVVSATDRGQSPVTFAFAPGGFVSWGAEKPSDYGASGSLMPVALAQMTKDGIRPLTAPGKGLSKDHLALKWEEEIHPVEPGIVPPAEGDKGIVVRGVEHGNVENNYFVPIGAKIYSHWNGPAANRRSTRVYDIGPDGSASKIRNGPIDVLSVIAYSPLRGEWVPVLNGANDIGTVAAIGPADIRTSDLYNSGGGTSRVDVNFNLRVVPVYDRGGRPSPIGESSYPTPKGSATLGTGGLRYVERGPGGAVHVYHGSDNWLGDADTCSKHKYATGVATDENGSETVHECASHAPTNTLWKLVGNPIFDASMEFQNIYWKAAAGIGKLTHVYLRYDLNGKHSHRGKDAPGQWKWEVPIPLQQTTTPGTKVGGGPTDPIQCLQPLQAAAFCPLPTPNTFSYTSETGIGTAAYPLNGDAWDKVDTTNTPYVGGIYSWAKQTYGGGFAKATKPTGLPIGANVATGGSLELPPDVFPTSRGSRDSYYLGSLYRDNIKHYRIRDGFGRVDPIKGQVVDGFRRAMEGSRGAWELVYRAYLETGVETQTYPFVVNTTFRADGPVHLGATQSATIAAGIVTLPDSAVCKLVGGGGNLDQIIATGTNRLVVLTMDTSGYTVRDKTIAGGAANIKVNTVTGTLAVDQVYKHFTFLCNYGGGTDCTLVGCC